MVSPTQELLTLVIGPDTMIYWTGMVASHRRSSIRVVKVKEEEDIWVELGFTVCVLVDRARQDCESKLMVGGPGRLSHTRGLKKYKNSTSVPWDRTTRIQWQRLVQYDYALAFY